MSNQTISESMHKKKVARLKTELAQKDQIVRQYGKQVNALEAINDLAQNVVGNFSINRIVESTYEKVLSVVAPDMVIVHLVEEDRLISKGEKPANPVFREASEEKKQIGQCLCGLVVQDKAPIYALDIQTESRCTLKECKKAGIQSFACIPFVVDDQALGVIGVGSMTERDFSREADFLETISSLVAIGLRTAILYNQLRNDTHELENQTKALKESEENYRKLFNNLQEGIWGIDKDAYTIFANPRMADMLGYTVDEMIGKHLFDFMDEEGIALCKRNLERRELGITEQHDFEFVKKDQTPMTALLETYPTYDDQGEYSGGVASVMDITQRRRSEEAFQFTQFAVDYHSDAAFWMGADARLIYVNEAACRSLGYSNEELLEMTVHDFDPNFPREAWTDHWNDLKTRGSFLIETHHRSKNGTVFPVDISVNYVKFGEKEYNCAFARNVSDRKQMEEELRQSEEKYRELFQSASDSVFLVDMETLEIVDANANAIELYGYRYDELLKMKATDLSDEPLKTRSAIQLEPKKIIPIRYHRKKDGSVFPVEITANFTTLGEKKINIRSIRDISKRLEMEKDRAHLEAVLRESQKMEAIATLAGGVAHQFNNALAAVTGNIELLKEDIPNYEYIADYIDPIKVSAKKMVRLTKQLLAYARGGKYYSSILSTSDFLRNTIPLIKHKIAPKVDLDTDLPSTVSHIKADPTQIQMVISEILQNASEAVGGTGRVKISARNVEIKKTRFEEQTEIIPATYVCLEIEDNGKGMDQETKDRLFDPFFTKKFEGRGLGMAAAFGIVKNHGGWISVKSEVGTGTTVQVYLPETEVRPGKAAEKVAVRTAGSGTVLIVDDDTMFMNFATRALGKLGYNILKAETGKDAIGIYSSNEKKIDLVLLDLILPEMEGGEIYERLKAINPKIKVLLSSGYAMDNEAKRILSHGCDGFIQKPFTIGELSQRLKEVLDKS